MPLLPVSKANNRAALLADRHYSRQKPGTRQFMPPGETLVLLNPEATALFGWLKAKPELRADHQVGVQCTIFRNESPARSSHLILEAEQQALRRWGPTRAFTYVNPAKVISPNPGYCFKIAGWKHTATTKTGLHLLEKELRYELDPCR